jgi:MoaA/NifB/PqqE/SkfB family radical SAM enzyme
VVELARTLSVKKISVSNLLAYCEALKDNILYKESQTIRQNGSGRLSLPPMDFGDDNAQTFFRLAAITGRNPLDGKNRNDVCPFIERGSMSIRWDGKVSPCWPLLYTHEHYLGHRLRQSSEYFAGSVLERSVRQIWEDPAYVTLRKKIGEFEFPPCTQCNNCEMADGNQEDCIGNHHPACGGCLWAQGYIVCP